MTDKRFEKLAKENNMYYELGSIYGIRGRYHVCTNYKNDGIKETFSVRFSLINLSDEDRYKIVNFVEENAAALKLDTASFNQNLVTIDFSIVPLKKRTFAIALDRLAAFFEENGFVSGCSVAQSDSNVRFVPYRGQVIALSREVSDKIKNEDKAIIRKSNERGYLPGIIGASIGGLIGTIPWILIGSLGRVSTISGFIMSALTKLGYDKANGRQSNGQLPILISINVIFTYLGIIAAETFKAIAELMSQGYLLAQIDIAKAFSLMAAYPFTPESIGSGIWGSILIGMLFAAGGSIFFIMKIKGSLDEQTGDTVAYSVPQPINQMR